MLNYNDAFYQLRNALQSLYDTQEAAAIAHEAMYAITGLDKLQRLTDKGKAFTLHQQQLFSQIQASLLTGMPLQYVLGYSWFMDRQFGVNEHVLIPRPETEELVQWIISDWQDNKDITILDVGTGSGCIPISLKLAMPGSHITTCDISDKALMVASENAQRLQAEVQFCQLNFLQPEYRAELSSYDVIVSNPPYIPFTEKASLHKNVRDFEPGIALFVPGDDALLFYREIAAFGKTHLKPGGAIYCELHTDHALATNALFEQAGYTSVEVKKDMHGNLRMLRAS